MSDFNVTRSVTEMYSFGRSPLPVTAYLVAPHLALACVVAARPPLTVRLAAVCALAAFMFRGATQFTMGDNRQDYRMGCAFTSLLFNACNLLLIANPMEDYRHESSSITLASLPLLERTYWAICIVFSVRGVGWNWQVSHLPSAPKECRSAFVLQRLLRAAYYYLVVDVLQSFVLYFLNPMYLPKGGDALPLHAHGYMWLCVNVAVRRTLVWFTLMLPQYCLAAAHVALGMSEPRHWPDICGTWDNVYTLRGFWGRTWHQMLRRYTTSVGKYCCRLFNLPPGSWQSSYTQLYVGFIVSGLLHSGGDVMASKGTFGASFWFYFSQAFAITFEDMIVANAKKMGMRFPMVVERALGYVWVFWWGTISLGYLHSYSLRIGAEETLALPFSPVMATVNYSQRHYVSRCFPPH